MKPDARPIELSKTHTRPSTLAMLGAALLTMPLFATAQTVTTSAAPYECSGLEGAALTSCRNLNAAAANSATITTNPGTSHDCSGMTGASLTTCQDLNGQIPQSPPRGSTAGQSPSRPATGQVVNTPSSAGSAAADRSVGPTLAPDLRAPDGGHVPPPSDRIVPIIEGGQTMPVAPGAAPAGANSRSTPAAGK